MDVYGIILGEISLLADDPRLPRSPQWKIPPTVPRTTSWSTKGWCAWSRSPRANQPFLGRRSAVTADRSSKAFPWFPVVSLGSASFWVFPCILFVHDFLCVCATIAIVCYSWLHSHHQGHVMLVWIWGNENILLGILFCYVVERSSKDSP